MTTPIQRHVWNVHPAGGDDIETLAEKMFAWSYPRGMGKYALNWDELRRLALHEWKGPIPAKEAQKIRRFWRGLAEIASAK